ncbi:MAG: hypothetical protein KDA77_22265, partial [Planctomycetaceae bacterium]|nr:hypothetical protein [Planctomycetaceae bacterium]
MFQLTENKAEIYGRLREYIRTNIPDFYQETEPDSNEYTYQSQAQASRLAGDFISSSSKYDAVSWGGYTNQILNQLTDEERYLFVERVSETFNISSIQGIYADPPVRVQDLVSWARRDPSSVLDIQQNESGTLNLNIQGLYEDEIPAFQRLYDSGTQNQPITVQYDSYDPNGMGYTESTVYRDFFNSIPYNFDGIRRVDQVATRYSLKMILKELYRQGYEVGFKIDSCCWGTADLSRDIVIAAVYPIKGSGLSERQGKRATRLINYLSGRFKAETGNGADVSRPNYSTSGTLKVSGSEWDFTTESFLRRYF